MATKKWVPIVVGIVIFVVLVGVGLIGSLVYFVRRDVKVQTDDGRGGAGRVRSARRRGWPARSRSSSCPPRTRTACRSSTASSRRTAPGRSRPCTSASGPRRQKKLARVDLPFWLMRLGGNKPFTVNAGPLNDVTLHVTPEEIDRRGPGLIVLWTTSRDARLLVWTE